MSRRLAALVAGGLLGGALLAGGWITGAGARPASAHALLSSSVPADGSSVDKSPAEVVLTFTEAPDPRLTVVKVLDATGSRVDPGRVELIPGQPNKVRVPLAPLANGTYTVAWRATSASDGHTTAGSVAFGIGVAAPVLAGSGTPTGVRAPSASAVGGRWLFYAGAILLLGAGVVGVGVVARPATLSVWLLNGAWAAAALGMALTINDQRSITGAGLAALFRSSTGHKLAAQAAAVGVVWLGVCWASMRPSRRAFGAVALGSGALMLTRSVAGHADASTVPWFTVAVQWVHLVSVGAWIGGLAWLLVALRKGDPGQGRGLAWRFSAMAGVMLALAAVSGTVRAADEVGAWGRLFTTSFGVTLLVKVGLFGVLVALGARSRYRHVRGGSAADAPQASRAGLRRTVMAEVIVAAAVLGATSLLTGLPPSTAVAAAAKLQRATSVTVSGTDYATSVRVRVVVSPGTAGPNRFDLTVVDYDTRKPVPADAVTLQLENDDRPELGTSTVELDRDPDGHWLGTGNALSIEGRWTMTASVQTSSDTVEARMGLVAGRPAS